MSNIKLNDLFVESDLSPSQMTHINGGKVSPYAKGKGSVAGGKFKGYLIVGVKIKF